ncbi:MAG: hypothetical protein ABIV25_03110, partial [Paracoccaceae bacterium]
MMTPGASQSQTTQALFGISGIFLINGVIVGSLATHFAALKTRLAVDPQVFSLVVMAMVAGTILAIGLSNWPLRRFGSACVLRICVVAAPLAFVLPSLSPSPALAAGSLFVLGGAAGLMDVAMNVHASTIERIAGRLVMARIHAVWSVGGILGAVTTGYALDKASPVTHSVALATLALIAVFFLTRLLLPASADKGGPAQPWSLPPGQILPIAGLVFLVIFCAGAMRDWSAVYLSESFATDHTVSAWGFAAF